MSIPGFNDLLVQVDREAPDRLLSDAQAELLERIQSAAEQSIVTIAAGIGSLGELIAVGSESGELSANALIGAGWLIHHLADTLGRLHHEHGAAQFKLLSYPREVSAQ